MGGVSYADVCTAVSEACGFGTFGMTAASPERIREEMRAVRARTDRPFGVDLLAALPETIEAAVLYLYIVPASFAAYGVLICVNSAMNASGKPLVATALMVGRSFLLYVPLAWVGSLHLGLWGIFAAGLVASLVTGSLAWMQRRRLL
jgi:enoyl-[acyl-carrier protein] reductase II